jgi:hypothetical protein
MARLPKIRISTQVPFPAMVTGAGPITLTKINGVWQIGYNPMAIAPGVPNSYPNAYVLYYDAVTGTVGRMSLSAITRTKLTGPVSVNVDPVNGNDSNVIVPGSILALKTIQAAYNLIVDSWDLNGNIVTIQGVAGATHTDALVITQGWVGPGAVTIDLGGGFWSTTGASCLSVVDTALPGILTVQNGTLATITSGNCILMAGSGANLFIGTGIKFGACAGSHMIAQMFAHIEILNNYTITGGAPSGSHALAQLQGEIDWSSAIVTVSGTPAFANFAAAYNLGLLLAFGGSAFSGSATGSRYLGTLNSVINTSGGGANFFPGNAAGSTNTGAQYA